MSLARQARFTIVQSASGLLLALFMWAHMAFVSTILISKDAVWSVTQEPAAAIEDRVSQKKNGVSWVEITSDSGL